MNMTIRFKLDLDLVERKKQLCPKALGMGSIELKQQTLIDIRQNLFFLCPIVDIKARRF
jgi:hypothetical protein